MFRQCKATVPCPTGNPIDALVFTVLRYKGFNNVRCIMISAYAISCVPHVCKDDQSVGNSPCLV